MKMYDQLLPLDLLPPSLQSMGSNRLPLCSDQVRLDIFLQPLRTPSRRSDLHLELHNITHMGGGLIVLTNRKDVLTPQLF